MPKNGKPSNHSNEIVELYEPSGHDRIELLAQNPEIFLTQR
jgi:hypothetical protein